MRFGPPILAQGAFKIARSDIRRTFSPPELSISFYSMSIARFLVLLVTTAANEEASFNDFVIPRRLAECGEHEETCKCMMGCEVNGGDSGACNDNKDNNGRVVQPVLTGMTQFNVCDIMKCMIYCANDQGCVDNDMKESCSKTKAAACTDIDCSGAETSTVFGLTTFVSVMVMMHF